MVAEMGSCVTCFLFVFGRHHLSLESLSFVAERISFVAERISSSPSRVRENFLKKRAQVLQKTFICSLGATVLRTLRIVARNIGMNELGIYL